MKRQAILILLLLALVAAAYSPARSALLAIHLARALSGIASGETAQDLPVEVAKVLRPGPAGHLEARIYSPQGGLPRTAVILVPGISELGIYHPRLVALSRSMAHNGFLVLTPDIKRFREFEMAPEAMDEMAFWFDQINRFPAAARIEKSGFAGISFSGTLALMTAARPELRDRVSFVLSIGAYQDPLRCSREWFAAGPITVGPGYYPTRYYARWILMLAALDMLPDPNERAFLDRALRDFLLQRPPAAAPAGLSPESARWLSLATMRENEADPELSEKIERHLAPILQRITPDRAAAEIRCPVFLVHGAHDDLIPTDESVHLRQAIRGARSHMLITPLLTHTHPFSRQISRTEKARAAADFLWFFFRFAREIR